MLVFLTLKTSTKTSCTNTKTSYLLFKCHKKTLHAKSIKSQIFFFEESKNIQFNGFEEFIDDTPLFVDGFIMLLILYVCPI